MPATAWVDDEGQIIKNVTNMMGMQTVMMRTTKEKALAEFSPPEFFAPTTIEAGRTIDRKVAQRIDYVLSPRNKAFALTVPPETGMQKVTGQADGNIDLSKVKPLLFDMSSKK